MTSIPWPSQRLTSRDEAEKTRFWGLYRGVDFGVLRRIADEQLETARRRALQLWQPARKMRKL